ncbi:adenosylcobinamide amidohydrolase [Mesorhizobium sp. DCY119]|uniref:adenosylcobinamide amidohydrolase n=1 Tax=Mesorhizobium sp. DCY119 TaxID=2108445 RepID=UPI001FDF871F|nr:adenosylcobinamide amidohydrolase [Mesorhizobium sp. DCY119]
MSQVLPANAIPDKSPGMRLPELHCRNDVLALRFEEEQWVLSWSLTRPGFVRTRAIAWLRVADVDLPIGIDPRMLLGERLGRAGFGDAVQMMTSRDVSKYHQARSECGETFACCLATVGLANACRVGDRSFASKAVGTINLAVYVNRPLDQAGMIEALSIATEARTAAVMDLGWRRDGAVVTGTGTDCIAMACPISPDGESFAGLHTDVGAAIGGSVYRAVHAGGLEWIAERKPVVKETQG